ncbi:MAG TPA: hypothetical protein VMY41_18470 [Thermohalobaculum sp.]|nr:hypothetical protein [Thermohalobaculum sp.]
MNEMNTYGLKGYPGPTHSLSTNSLSTQIAGKLGWRIVAKTYGPGDLIEDETALAKAGWK